MTTKPIQFNYSGPENIRYGLSDLRSSRTCFLRCSDSVRVSVDRIDPKIPRVSLGATTLRSTPNARAVFLVGARSPESVLFTNSTGAFALLVSDISALRLELEALHLQFSALCPERGRMADKLKTDAQSRKIYDQIHSLSRYIDQLKFAVFGVNPTSELPPTHQVLVCDLPGLPVGNGAYLSVFDARTDGTGVSINSNGLSISDENSFVGARSAEYVISAGDASYSLTIAGV
ncbi:hypothetical protein HY990_01205 [Candidatus Micrarchaeota archaeon]|nr:hypothetical protein [Candidatus Micrarchaeota archaeon]